MSKYIDIVFDGPPSHQSGRFVESEDDTGASIRAGEWIEDGDLWRLRIPNPADEIERLTAEVAQLKADRERLVREGWKEGFWRAMNSVATGGEIRTDGNYGHDEDATVARLLGGDE